MVVEARGLTKRYGGIAVVDDLDLEVRRGEVLGILGMNGAGKTTAVECIQGLRHPDAGSVRVCGLDPISDRRSLVDRIGSQLQDSALPDRMKVEEAIRLFAAPGAASVEATLDSWGLTEHRRAPFASLSGGQQQRLFVALALLNDPEVVFLDELTQGLDPHARMMVWDLVRRLRDGGTTVVLVTHFFDEAEVLCDRLMVMRDGEAVARGTPIELIGSFGSAAIVSFTPPPGVDPAQAFGRLPGLDRLEHHGERVRLIGSRALIAHAGAALVAAGPVPDDLSVEQPDLEHVLLPALKGDR